MLSSLLPRSPIWLSRPAQAAPVPTHAVSQAGQLEYNYEALLYHSFGPHAQLCRSLTVPVNGVPTHVTNWWLGPNFSAPYLNNQNLSMANCSAFIYTFANYGRSAFHLEPSWFAVNNLCQHLRRQRGAGTYQRALRGVQSPGHVALDKLLRRHQHPVRVHTAAKITCRQLGQIGGLPSKGQTWHEPAPAVSLASAPRARLAGGTRDGKISQAGKARSHRVSQPSESQSINWAIGASYKRKEDQ